MSDDHGFLPSIQDLAEAEAQRTHTPEAPKPIEGLDNTVAEHDKLDVAIEGTHSAGDLLVAGGEIVLGEAGAMALAGAAVTAVPLAVSLESFPPGPCPASTCPTCSQEGQMSGGDFPCVMHASHKDEHICAQGHNWF
jgi:hypothetical protein